MKRLWDRTWPVLGVIALVSMVGWAFWSSFSTPTGTVEGPPQTQGLPGACALLDPATVKALVPGAVPSRRDLSRVTSACTLTGGGRTARIEITRYEDADGAKAGLAGARRSHDVMARSWAPKAEKLTGLGDEAVVFRGPEGDGAGATLLVRQGGLLLVIGYSTPPGPGGLADRARYTAAADGAQRIAKELFGRL